MAKRVVMIYGPPGAGKGTQANLLAWSKGFIHFDTGRFLEQFVNDEDNQKDPAVKDAKQKLDSGELVDPAFVLKLTIEKAKEIAKAGFNLVFSGSPRTMFEAFGDEKNEGLISVLEKEYGKKSVFPVFLEIDPKLAIQRNKVRKICSNCKNAMLMKDIDQHKSCALCGGKLVTRSVDNPEVFETRIKEYTERTKPIVDELKNKGYKVYEIDGLPAPVEVFDKLKKVLNL